MNARFILAAAVALAFAPSLRAELAPDARIAGLTEQKTIFGAAFADSKGRTLYTFDGDGEAGKSACAAACVDQWRPFPAPRIAKPVGDWTPIASDDGSLQWAWKGKPLYTYAGDLAPADINGDGADGKWHAFMRARDPLPAGVAVRTTELGPTFATTQGMTLYMVVQYRWNAAANNTPRHVGPSPGIAACADDCLHTWLPLTASADAKQAGDWTLVDRPDGSRQWAWKGNPLYTYAKDEKPGDALGEGNHTLLNGITGYFWEAANLL